MNASSIIQRQSTSIAINTAFRESLKLFNTGDQTEGIGTHRIQSCESALTTSDIVDFSFQ